MKIKKEYNCIIVTSGNTEIPIEFGEEQYNFEVVGDEKEALNEIKIKNIDFFIIKGPFKYLEDDELFKIVVDRTENDNKNMIIIEIKEKINNEFEIKKMVSQNNKYTVSLIIKNKINIKELLEI